MVPATVEHLLQTENEEDVERLLDDHETFLLVDWREEDEAIVGACEDILRTGDLSAELVEIDADPGYEPYVSHRGRRVKIPFVGGPGDRHITMHTLNQLLKPAYEIRVYVDSHLSDTLAFLPLPGAGWAALETRFGEKVARRFRKIEEHPNLFTDSWLPDGP